MADEPKGFLGRWSQRKAEVLQRKPSVNLDPAQAALSNKPVGSDKTAAQTLTDTAESPVPTAVQNVEGAAPPLTLEDARLLTSDSDFKPFMTSKVEPGVRNAAMKKLFSDPHYNIMDGLDIYIDDYSKSDPIPESMLRQMVGAKFLNLFNEDKDTPNPEMAGFARENAHDLASKSVAQSSYEIPDIAPPEPAGPPEISQSASLVAGTSQEDHAHTDLRLQPDDAAPASKAGRSAE